MGLDVRMSGNFTCTGDLVYFEKMDGIMTASVSERLAEELTSINQYMVHAEMCENWK